MGRMIAHIVIAFAIVLVAIEGLIVWATS